MTVRNGSDQITESIDSILSQSFSDFELIIIDDGSTDNTLEILNRFSDQRIRIFTQKNCGVAKSANRALRLALGKYIARQDHDDLSLPLRFEKQIDFLENNSQCALVGTRAEIWSSEGPTGRFHDHPTCSGVLAYELIFNNPFVHSSCMFRSDVLNTLGGYCEDEKLTPPEDYELISRISHFYDVANLEDRLVIYRENKYSLSSSLRSAEINLFSPRLALITSMNISHYLKVPLDKKNLSFGKIFHNVQLSEIDYQANYFQLRKLIKKSTLELMKRYKDDDFNKLEKNKIDALHFRYYKSPGYCGALGSAYYLFREKIISIKHKLGVFLKL